VEYLSDRATAGYDPGIPCLTTDWILSQFSNLKAIINSTGNARENSIVISIKEFRPYSALYLESVFNT